MSGSTTEIVVVGAGIAGSSAALYLARLGHDVTMLERGDVASGASGLNMGGLGGAGWGQPPDLLGYLTAGSVELFKELAIDMGHDIELRLSGTLQAIQTEAQYEFARDQIIAAGARGDSLELLSAREAKALEPEFCDALPGALYAAGRRGQADPVKATRAFATSAAAAGARIQTHAEVTAIAAKGHGFAISVGSEVIDCATLVLAAGAWSAPLGAMLGLDIPVVPIRGQMWATEPLPPKVFHTIAATESPLDWSRFVDRPVDAPPALTHYAGARVTRHLYGRQNRLGEVIFGGDREQLGFTDSLDEQGVAANQDHAAEILPFLGELPRRRTWNGLMPFTRDGRPLIGALPGHDNLFIVGGLASTGFGRGPMAGKLLAETLHQGHSSSLLAEADPRDRVAALS